MTRERREFPRSAGVASDMKSPSRVAVTRAATCDLDKAKSTPLEKLRKFLETAGMRSKTGPRAFEEFEREVHNRMMEAERDIVAGEMARHVNVDAVVIAGKVHRRVLRQSQTYMTSAGEVVVERTLYKDRTGADGRCVSPMGLALGIVGDFWTPRAAQQAAVGGDADDAEEERGALRARRQHDAVEEQPRSPADGARRALGGRSRGVRGCAP